MTDLEKTLDQICHDMAGQMACLCGWIKALEKKSGKTLSEHYGETIEPWNHCDVLIHRWWDAVKEKQ